jgi:hypothetical protein
VCWLRVERGGVRWRRRDACEPGVVLVADW